ncbi:MAG: hypothetical protein NC102_09680 [Clostridium sp.]|nr:hypothetical protein [Clostridium sp.]
MKNIFLALIALVPLLACAVDPFDYTGQLQRSEMERKVPDDEEDVYMLLVGEAETAIAADDYFTAILRLREAMENEPDNPLNPLLLSNLGNMYMRVDQDSLAMQAFNDALAMEPSLTAIYGNRGRLRLKMGDDKGAFEDFNTVVAKDSLNATGRYYRGLMSLYSGDAAGAEEDFHVLQKVDPLGYNTNVALSSLYARTGRELQAIPFYEKLIADDPAAEYYAALAGCYLAIDYLSEASATIQKALEKYPYDPDLYYYRAWLNKERFMLDDAKADAAKAVRLGADPKKVAALFSK